MRLLLDTHIFLWGAVDPVRMPRRAVQLIAQAEQVFVSTACIWELAIKARQGKLAIDIHRLIATVSKAGFHKLVVRFPHAALVAALPLLHSDPFDRILVAQAIYESMQLVTVDKQLAAYSPLVQVV